jgi:hypothetical protein
LKETKRNNFKSNEPCVCCGENRDGFVTYHHLLTQKARPELRFFRANIIPVCQFHHNEFHSKPISEMATKYRNVEHWLIVNGWGFDSGKWRLFL